MNFIDNLVGSQNSVYIYIIGACSIIYICGSIYMHVTKGEYEMLDSRELRMLYIESLQSFNTDTILEIPNYIYSSEELFRFLLSATHNFSRDSLAVYFSNENKNEFYELYNFLSNKPKLAEFEKRDFRRGVIYNFVFTVKHDFLFLD